MEFNFDEIDFSKVDITEKSQKDSKTIEYDKTTTETYRIKRMFKIDPLTDQEVPEKLRFEFEDKWDPISGEIIGKDEVGPLCFNALTLYDYYNSNRYKGLWNPPQEGFEGYYGDMVGTGNKIEIKSRGSNPEKYLFRLPIIDCYLAKGHNLSIITMGPLLSDEHINKIDEIVSKYHNKKFLTSLKKIKKYYDNAIDNNPSCDEFMELKSKYPNLNEREIIDKFNRLNVDFLVKSKN